MCQCLLQCVLQCELQCELQGLLQGVLHVYMFTSVTMNLGGRRQEQVLPRVGGKKKSWVGGKKKSCPPNRDLPMSQKMCHMMSHILSLSLSLSLSFR